MISNLQFRCRDLFFDSHKLFSRFSFRNPRSAFVDPVARPSNSRSLRSVLHRKRHLRQAGSHFPGLATSIRELSRLVLAPQVFVRSIEHWVSVHRDKIVEKLALFIRDFDEA